MRLDRHADCFQAPKPMSVCCPRYSPPSTTAIAIVMARDAVSSSSGASHDAIIDLFHRRFDVQVEVAEVAEILEAWRPG